MLPFNCRQWGVVVVSMLVLVGLTVQDRHANSTRQLQPTPSHSHREPGRRNLSETNNARPAAAARPARQTVNKTPRRTSDKPNIVFIITDDQDVELGSLNFMPKTARAVRDEGASFVNAFVTTPMCCPSRSSMLTGMYVHNHNVYTNNDNCSSEQWRQTHETQNFGTYLTNAGYRTGYFGKYLNEYTGAYIPPGWTEWVGLIRNTRFYNYTLNYNGQKIKHEDNYHKDYLTDVIANESVRFLRESKQYFPNRPVAMVLSMPAPHGPEDAAPQYQHMFMDVKSHRTPSWNFAPNPDKQWLLQYTGKMTPIQIAFTDILQTKRLQTLQSVDDAVEKVVDALTELEELDNTYIIYTSDHGYHLGQYGLVKGKAMPYDFDIRVPFYMRGPKINPGTRVPSIVLNLDIAPTLLDIAGIPTPDHMDGSSVLKLLDGHPDSPSNVRRRRTWRDTFLVERGKLTQRKLKVQEKLEAQYNRLVTTKEQRLEDECLKPEYQSPCQPRQQWECRRNEHGKLRVYKCRFDNRTAAVLSSRQQSRCNCHQQGVAAVDREMDADEIQRQLDFLQHHVNQPRMVEPRFISERIRRDVRKSHKLRKATSTSVPSVTPGADREESDEATTALVDVAQPMEWIAVNTGHDDIEIPCGLTANGTVVCERYVYSSDQEWVKQKSRIDSVINNYKHRVAVLESIRRHLIEYRPASDSKKRSTISSATPSVTTDVITTSERTTDATTAPTRTAIPSSTSSEQPTTGMMSSVDSFDEDADDDEETDDEDSDTEEDFDSKVVNEDNCVCDDEIPESRRSKTKKADSKLETLAKDVEDQEERESLRKHKMAQNRLSKAYSASARRQRHRKSEKRRTKSVFNCSSPDVHCSDSYTSFRTTPPSGPVRSSDSPWEGIDFSHYSSRRDPVCHIDGLECSRMDDEHWKTAPYWTHGPFCICPNSNNNTYWCLRTMNDTHNFLYCEFITGFISYYDMSRDPYQLRNAVHDLSFAILHQLHDALEVMKGCKGSRKCNLRAKLSSLITDDHRDSSHPVVYDNRGAKNVDQPADSSRSKWLRTKGVRHG